MSDTPTTEKLTKALTEAGIPFELDDKGQVNATPEVVEFLQSKESLHDPDNPVVLTKEELMYGTERDGDEMPDYEFRESKDIEAELAAGDVQIGPSTLEALSPRHQSVEVYIGPVKELQGEGVLAKRNPRDFPEGIAVQFDDRSAVLNGRALGYGWHEFPKEHISDARPFIDRWRDVPSQARATVRKIRKIPRIHQNGQKFMTPKQMRRGVPGATGNNKARKHWENLKAREGKKPYLVNIITEGEDENKSIAVSATTPRRAEAAAMLKHKRDFPDAEILDIEVHQEEVAR